jgi:hypothetical protein
MSGKPLIAARKRTSPGLPRRANCRLMHRSKGLRYAMTSSALASNVGGMAKRFASNQIVSKYLPRLQCGRK